MALKEITITKPFMVRNLKTGPTSFTPDGGQEIRWQGYGDHNGETVMLVPLNALENQSFLEAINRGTLEVVDGPTEVLDAVNDALNSPYLKRARQVNQAKTDEYQDSVNSHVARVDTRDAHGIPCVGPGPRGGVCGVLSPVMAKDLKTNPPLCNNHKHLAREYVPEEGEVGPDGKAVTHWRKAIISR